MRILIAVALMWCVGTAYSQQPISTGGGATQQRDAKPSKAARNPVTEERGTQQQPIFIKSLPAPESEADAGHKDYEYHEKPMLERFMGWGTLALATFTFVLFVFTGLLWWVTLQLSTDAQKSGEAQSKKMEDSIREASKAATAMENLAVSAANNASVMHEMYKKQMRAYIAIETSGGVYQDANNRFAANPTIVNSGFTPARNLSFSIRSAVLRIEGVAPKDLLIPEHGELIENDGGMAPRQQFVISDVVNDRYTTEEVTEIMLGDKKRLYVWGIVNYEDIFGGKWYTRFCYNHVFHQRVDKSINVGSYYHHTGNDAT